MALSLLDFLECERSVELKKKVTVNFIAHQTLYFKRSRKMRSHNMSPLTHSFRNINCPESQ